MHRVIVGGVGLAAIVMIAGVVVTRQTTSRTQEDRDFDFDSIFEKH